MNNLYNEYCFCLVYILFDFYFYDRIRDIEKDIRYLFIYIN